MLQQASFLASGGRLRESLRKAWGGAGWHTTTFERPGPRLIGAPLPTRRASSVLQSEPLPLPSGARPSALAALAGAQPSSQGVTFQTRGVGINFNLNLTVLARLIQDGILRTLRGAPKMRCGPGVRGTVWGEKSYRIHRFTQKWCATTKVHCGIAVRPS